LNDLKEDIETSLDRLLEYVNKAGKVPLADAASAIGRPPTQVERLALLLEEKGLLEVNYNLTGIKISAPRPEGNGTQARQDESGIATAPLGVIEQAKQIESEMIASESLLKFFEKDLERRVERAQKTLLLMEKSDYTREEISQTLREMDLAIRQLDAFEKEISAMALRGSSFRQQLVEFKQKLAKMKPVAAAQRTESRTLKAKLAKIVWNIIAFMEFIRRDLQKLLHNATARKSTRATHSSKAAKTGGKNFGAKAEAKKQKRARTPKLPSKDTQLPHTQKHSIHEGKARVVRLRKDGPMEHYWVLEKNKRKKAAFKPRSKRAS